VGAAVPRRGRRDQPKRDFADLVTVWRCQAEAMIGALLAQSG
jgi:hypothetical protein